MLVWLCWLGLLLVGGVRGGALQLTPANIADTIRDHELVMINFYADWCR